MSLHPKDNTLHPTDNSLHHPEKISQFLSGNRMQSLKSPSPIHDNRWRSAWSQTKSKLNLWDAELLESKKRLTKEDIGGSDDYKVTHLSEYLEDDNIMWYKSPAFRYIPTDNCETILIDLVKKKKDAKSREFLRGGPREEIFFSPGEVVVAIATCGGLCPGLNSVIRQLVLCLWYTYGVRQIFGIKFGYEGFYKHSWVKLTPEIVSSIHHSGGTILGTSRGGFDKDKIIEAILTHKANQVFLIGGDGTHRGADVLFQELKHKKMNISVVGIPKTIDNDIDLIDRSFGFDTAVQEAVKAIKSAHVEAKAVINGIGIVVLMGRASGFIAVNSTLASGEVNVCLIPEVPFVLDGPTGLLGSLKDRLRATGHVVIVVAEGAGQDLLKPAPGVEVERDKSGNPKLPDIGSFLKNKIKDFFEQQKIDFSIKYIDPSYMIRSIPANGTDSIYTLALSQNAVFGAMAGFSGFTVAYINNHYCYVPITAVTTTRKVDPHGDMWTQVLEITGQPDFV